MTEFHVYIINPKAGPGLCVGDVYPARQGNRAGRYDILLHGEWVSINADYASVL